jgi:type III restriction enzyme
LKFTLKDYQEQAVDDVLSNLKRARENFKNPDKREISSFSLTATTGAGKTVMAAAVIEALFWGNDTFDFAPDPGAIVLWFSDDQSLNRRSTGSDRPPRSSPTRISCTSSRHLPNRGSTLARFTS